MVEIENKTYPVEYVKKAIRLYEALLDGSLEAQIKEGLENG